MRVIPIAIACAATCVLTHLSPVYADTLDKIKASGVILLGYRSDAPPFSSAATVGQPVGFSIDLCDQVVAGVKAALKIDRLDVKFIPVDAKTRFEKLETGDIDIECGASTRTLSREARVDFTLFTFLTGTEMLVPFKSDIRAPADLAGKKIAVLPGTTTETVMQGVIKILAVDAEIVTV